MLLATCRVSRVTCDVPGVRRARLHHVRVLRPGAEALQAGLRDRRQLCRGRRLRVPQLRGRCGLSSRVSLVTCHVSRVTCPGPGVNGIVNITISTESCSGCIGSGNPTGFVEGGVAVYLQVGQPATSSSSILHLSGRIRHRVYISGPGQSGDGGL